MATKPALRLLVRRDCGLCDEAAAALRSLGAPFEAVDIDRETELLRLYSDEVPVLLAGGEPIAKAPITAARLRRALRRGG